jgi:hypothetical protein
MSRYKGTAYSRLVVQNLEVEKLTTSGATALGALAAGDTSLAALKLSVGTVAAAGANQGNAAALPAAAIVTVTAADAAKGVRLPTAEAGRVVILKNVDNAVLKIYPATGGKINVLADNASLDIAARTATILFATSATQWFSLPLLPS